MLSFVFFFRKFQKKTKKNKKKKNKENKKNKKKQCVVLRAFASLIRPIISINNGRVPSSKCNVKYPICFFCA